MRRFAARARDRTSQAPQTWTLALDLGTHHVRAATHVEGVVLDARRDLPLPLPDASDGGDTAWSTTPVDVLDAMLRDIVRRTDPPSHWRVLAASSMVTPPPERAQIERLLRRLGAEDVEWVPAVLAAAVGGQLPVLDAHASLVVHAGHRATEVAVMSRGGFVDLRTRAIGGAHLDAALAQWLRRDHKLIVEPGRVEDLRIRCADVHPTAGNSSWVTGYEVFSGLPRDVEVDHAQVSVGIAALWDDIRNLVLDVLRDASPEACADLVETGVLLTGGLAQTEGLATDLADATGLPCVVAEQPERAVVEGIRALMGVALPDAIRASWALEPESA
jgi:rod shape-determining protein MreB